MYVSARNITRSVCAGLGACFFGALGCSTTPSSPAITPGPDGSMQMEVNANGLAWSSRPSLAGVELKAVWGDGQDVFAAGSGDAIAHSGDGGTTWSVTSAGVGAGAELHHIGGTSGADVWIAGRRSATEGLLLHSTDHGQTWATVDVQGATDLRSVRAIDAQQIARVAGTISYSVLTGIHARVKRIYV